VHAIHDESPRPLLADLARRAREAAPHRRVVVTAESNANDPRLIRPPDDGGLGLDAVWADDFHHALHALLTGEHESYYSDFGRVADLGKAFRRGFVFDGAYSRHQRRVRGAPADDRPPHQFVVCSQNHDQVGNRAFGDRPPEHVRRLAAFCVLLSPFTPLLFMGEENGETRPFQFFTDHIDPFIADATREGRRREFAAFAAFAGAEIPDPQATETFEASKLSDGVPDPELRALYAELLRVRRDLPRAVDEVESSEEPPWLRVRRGSYLLVANFCEREISVPDASAGSVVLATAPVTLADESVVLAPWSGALLR
jgi:maltooligosyltrehalose trehalohydrolase